MSATLRRAPLPVALMAGIYFLSGRSSVGPELEVWMTVVGHFLEYALLAAAWAWALAPSLGRRALPVAAAVSFVYAITDEWHQSFVPGRDSDPLDVLVDAVGIAAALFAVRRIGARRRRGAVGSARG